MKYKNQLILMLLALSLASMAHGKESKKEEAMAPAKHDKSSHKDHKNHDHSSQEAKAIKVGKDKIVVKVKGMVCAFCAQGIKKNFNKLDEVKNTDVDLDTMEVTVQLKPGKELDERVIEKVVTGAGFSYVGTK